MDEKDELIMQQVNLDLEIACVNAKHDYAIEMGGKIKAAREAQRIWDSLDREQKATAMNVYTEHYNKNIKT